MNNNLTSERAILGQYNTTSYITIQDPYLKKNQPLSRHKKKQFLTEPGHLGRSKDTMFAKAFPWLSEGDKYKTQQMYTKTQPLASRKKGFLSSDAHRRDEFSNVCRTEQHRWALGREAAMTKMHERNKKPGTADADSKRGSKSKSLESKPLAEVAPEFTTPHHLYDIGKGDSVTKFSQKLHREMWYHTQRDPKKPRRLGDYLPSSYEIGNEAVQETELHKPTYANTPIVQSTFYRVESVKSNAGWSGNPNVSTR